MLVWMYGLGVGVGVVGVFVEYVGLCVVVDLVVCLWVCCGNFGC